MKLSGRAGTDRSAGMEGRLTLQEIAAPPVHMQGVKVISCSQATRLILPAEREFR